MSKSILEQENQFVIPEISNGEIAIFVQRLVGIFEILMIKLELAAALPSISRDRNVLEILNEQDSMRVVTFLSRFTYDQEDLAAANYTQDELETAAHENSEESDSLEQRQESRQMSRPSYDLSSCSCGSVQDRADLYQLLRIFHSNPALLDLATNCSKPQMNKSNNFLRQIKYFMEFVISKMISMPDKERDKEVHLRQLIAEIEQSKLEISDLTVSLEEQKSRQRSEAQELANKLDRLLDQWQTIDEEYNTSLKQLLKRSQENKAKAFEELTARINDHQALFDKLKMQLANDKINNKKIEHEIQTLKFKVESQLTSLIMKFDTEIGDRQETYKNLMKEYDDLEQEKSQFMDDMNEQFIVYNGIMKEREEKAFAEYKEKYDKFVSNRSAKLIQRWWRSIRLKLRKKDKKKGKKKKAK